MTIQPPLSHVISDEGGCIESLKRLNYCKTWASAYQRIKSSSCCATAAVDTRCMGKSFNKDLDPHTHAVVLLNRWTPAGEYTETDQFAIIWPTFCAFRRMGNYTLLCKIEQNINIVICIRVYNDT